MAESGPAHGYGMMKVVTTAASAWDNRAWPSLDVMTAGVTAPSVMAVDIRGLSCRWRHRSSALRLRVRAAGRVESSGPGDSQGS